MSVGVDVAKDGVSVAISAARVRDVVREVCRREKVREGLISVTFVTSRAMARINQQHLGHRGATDIITFELSSVNDVVVGDMYIAPDVARANAREHGVGVREELVRLVVHGTLHVLGHTHPEDEARVKSVMWRKQEALVRALV